METSTIPERTQPDVVQRTPDGKFIPGVSPNPGGVSKSVREVIAKARNISADLLDELVDIAKDKTHDVKARIAASQVVLSYGLGKPPDFRIEDHDDADKLKAHWGAKLADKVTAPPPPSPATVIRRDPTKVAA